MKTKITNIFAAKTIRSWVDDKTWFTSPNVHAAIGRTLINFHGEYSVKNGQTRPIIPWLWLRFDKLEAKCSE
jgi:hypothetical protein